MDRGASRVTTCSANMWISRIKEWQFIYLFYEFYFVAKEWQPLRQALEELSPCYLRCSWWSTYPTRSRICGRSPNGIFPSRPSLQPKTLCRFCIPLKTTTTRTSQLPSSWSQKWRWSRTLKGLELTQPKFKDTWILLGCLKNSKIRHISHLIQISMKT